MSELLKREIGEVIRREIPVGSCGLISVNEVEVASDLHSATVYVSIFGSAEQQKQGFSALNANRKRLQSLLAQAVILKYTPQLRFVTDSSLERGDRVLRILKDLEKTEPPE